MRRSACENRGDLFLGAGSQIVDEPGCDRVVICTWISGVQGGRGTPRPARTRYQAGTHSGAHHTGDAAKRLTGALAWGLGPVGIGFFPSSRGHLRYDARQPLPERHWPTGPPDGGTHFSQPCNVSPHSTGIPCIRERSVQRFRRPWPPASPRRTCRSCRRKCLLRCALIGERSRPRTGRGCRLTPGRRPARNRHRTRSRSGLLVAISHPSALPHVRRHQPSCGSRTSPTPDIVRETSLSATTMRASRRRRYLSVRQALATSTDARSSCPECCSNCDSRRSSSVRASAVAPANPHSTRPSASVLTLRAFGFTIVLPRDTTPSVSPGAATTMQRRYRVARPCPSPIMTTWDPRRTHRIVVARS